MKEKIEQILKDLKSLKIPVSKIEKDLGFSNGLLKKYKLSPEKFEKFINYAKIKLIGRNAGSPIDIDTLNKEPDEEYLSKEEITRMKQKIKDAMAKTKALMAIQAYCDANGLKLDDLPDYITKLRLELSASHEALNAIKLKVEKKGWVKEDVKVYDSEKINNPKDEYDPYKNPAFLAKIGVKKTEKKETAD